MILSDRDIRAEHHSHGIIEPFTEENVQPASVDLTLGNTVMVWTDSTDYDDAWRMGVDWVTNEVSIKDDIFYLRPGEFILVSTSETISIPDHLVGQVAGKSSLMRNGLQVCGDAGYIDPGFTGQVTLELKNLGVDGIILRPGMKICQVVFTMLSSKAQQPYGSPELDSHYQGQEGPTGSAL